MTPTARDLAADFIKSHEGCRLKFYRDVCGNPTIGYGHRCGDGAADICQAEADALFDKDLAQIVADMEPHIKVPLTDNQAAALASFCFNLGVNAFAHGGPDGGPSTLLWKLNLGDFAGVAAEFLRWDHAHVDGKLVVVPGLTRRREAEKALFLKGLNMPDPVSVSVPVPPALEQHAADQANAAGTWVPDRKVLATVASNVVVFGLGWALPAFTGIPVPPEAVMAAAAAVSGMVGYVVPPSSADLMRRAPDVVAQLKETPPHP